MTLKVLDATGAQQILSTTTNPNDSGLVGSHCTTDPITGTKQNVNLQGQAFVTSDGTKSTYRYVGTFTPAATPTDMLIIQGSASKTGRIKMIMLAGISTSGGNILVSILRRSTANTGGTLNNIALGAGKHDTADLSATILPQFYTVNASSLGGLAGGYGNRRIWMPSATQQPYYHPWEFATRQDKALILRGTSDFIVINGNGATVPAGGAIDFEIEIEEDNS